MKKIVFLFLLCQSVFLTAQTKTVVTQYGEKVTINPYANNGLSTENGYTQLGGTLNKPTTIQTSETNTLTVSGLAKSTDSNDTPLVATSGGTLKKGTFPTINIIPDDIGTVIAIGGKLEVAQEITAQMTSNYINPGGTKNVYPIGNITNVIIDNKSRFTSSATGNSFSVVADGTYLISINAQVSSVDNNVTNNQAIVVGIIDNSLPVNEQWVARVNDSYPHINNIQTFTLTTSVKMYAGRTYTFATATSFTTTLYANSNGYTGAAPVSFFSVKRLR